MTASTSLPTPEGPLSLAGAPNLPAGFTDGHSAAWEEPDVFAGEVRAAFRKLRQ